MLCFVERSSSEVSSAVDIIWTGVHRYDYTAVHWLGCVSGGWGTQTEEQAI